MNRFQLSSRKGYLFVFSGIIGVVVAGALVVAMVLHSSDPSGNSKVSFVVNVPYATTAFSGSDIFANRSTFESAYLQALRTTHVVNTDGRSQVWISDMVEVDDVNSIPANLVVPNGVGTFSLTSNTQGVATPGLVVVFSFTAVTRNASNLNAYMEKYQESTLATVQSDEFKSAFQSSSGSELDSFGRVASEVFHITYFSGEISTPTPTSSPSSSPSSTSTHSSTSSVSPSITLTASSSHSETSSSTSSSTVSPTNTPTKTRTASNTPTSSRSPSSSASQTRTGTSSASATRSPSQTPSHSSSASMSSTISSTSSVSATASRTRSATITSTMTRSATATSSETPSATTTASKTRSATPSSSRTASPSSSKSSAVTPSTSPIPPSPTSTPCVWSRTASPTPGLAPSATLGACTPLAIDTMVNENTANAQEESEMCALDDTNGFAVVWMSKHQSNAYKIFLRIFDYNGIAITGDIQVSTSATSSHKYPKCAYIGKGELVVVWHASTIEEIRGRKLESSSGTPLSCEFTIYGISGVTVDKPDVTSTPSGGFIVAWVARTSGLYAVMTQSYDASAEVLLSATSVSGDTTARQESVNVDVLTNGNVVVQWHLVDNFNPIRDYYFRLVDGATMAMLNSETKINTLTKYGFERNGLATLPNGGFVVVYNLKPSWSTEPYARVYDNAGNAITVESIATSATDRDQYPKAVVPVGTSGKFLVVMTDDNRDGSGYAISAQLMNADATLDGTVFVVNDHTAGFQYYPSAIGLPNSKIAISWYSRNPDLDGDGHGVFMKMYCM